jgi:hypothetical protein
MRYFRSPQLAGKNLKRTVSATLRGNLRRSDPDVTSLVPYFPGVLPGMTLIVRVQGTTVTVGLPSNRFSEIVSTIRGALATAFGSAFDDGGCVAITSTKTGAAGFIEVIGGTAAALIGFDLSQQEFKARGGELTTAAEGRVAQPFGTALPNFGEGFTTESVNRALGRVMSNTDVLHSALLVEDGSFNQVSSGFSDTDLDTIVLPVAQKVLVSSAGPGVDTSDWLASHFVVVDRTTGYRAQSMVVGVENSLGVSLLNGNQSVAANVAIADIKNGRVVSCDASTFTASVQVGDFAEIAFANNDDPWSNNGLRWVVEEVIDDTHLALRPMSVREMDHVGTASDGYQPIVELNYRKVGVQSFGRISITRGPYAAGVTLRLSPPMPAGQLYAVWGITPSSAFDRKIGASLGAPSTTPQFDAASPMWNSLITRPAVSISGGAVYVSTFYVRWNGQGYLVPERDLPLADGFVVLDPVDCVVKMISAMAAGYLPIAHVVGTTVQPMMRLDAQARQAVVGAKAQFADLTSAIKYFASYENVIGGEIAEIMLTEGQMSPVGGWQVGNLNLRIRSVGDFAQIFRTTGDPYFVGGGSAHILLDSVIINTAVPMISGGRITLLNVRDHFGLYRGIDDSDKNIDLGSMAPGVDISYANKPTTVRGNLSVAGAKTLMLDNGDVWVGASGSTYATRLCNDGSASFAANKVAISNTGYVQFQGGTYINNLGDVQIGPDAYTAKFTVSGANPQSSLGNGGFIVDQYGELTIGKTVGQQANIDTQGNATFDGQLKAYSANFVSDRVQIFGAFATEAPLSLSMRRGLMSGGEVYTAKLMVDDTSSSRSSYLELKNRLTASPYTNLSAYIGVTETASSISLGHTGSSLSIFASASNSELHLYNGTSQVRGYVSSSETDLELITNSIAAAVKAKASATGSSLTITGSASADTNKPSSTQTVGTTKARQELLFSTDFVAYSEVNNTMVASTRVQRDATKYAEMASGLTTQIITAHFSGTDYITLSSTDSKQSVIMADTGGNDLTTEVTSASVQSAYAAPVASQSDTLAFIGTTAILARVEMSIGTAGTSTYGHAHLSASGAGGVLRLRKGAGADATMTAADLWTLVGDATNTNNADDLHTHSGLVSGGTLVHLTGDETITGVKTFSAKAIATSTSLGDSQYTLTTKDYVDRKGGVVAAGAYSTTAGLVSNYNITSCVLMNSTDQRLKYYRITCDSTNWPASESSLVLSGTLNQKWAGGWVMDSMRQSAPGPLIVEIEDFAARQIKVTPIVVGVQDNHVNNNIDHCVMELDFSIVIHRIGD